MTTTEQNGTALAVRDYSPDLAPRFAVSIDDLRAQVRQLEEFKRDIMTPEVDYGVIPGTPKPTLLKPGAEKLAMAFGLAPVFESANRIEDWERGFFHYEERCVLTSRRSGLVVASANGSANSREPRYRWRKSERTCPNCGKAAIIKGKADYGGGFICFGKKGGCGAKFADNDQAILGQPIGQVENPEPFELVNTILKMAEKRALVAAVLIATGGSGIWTQDVEDMPSIAGDHEREVIDVSPHQQPQATATPKGPMVSTEDSPMWQRWSALVAEAQSLGMAYPDVKLPIASALLQSTGAKLRADIDQRKRRPTDADVPMVRGVQHHLYQTLAERIEQIGIVGLDPAPYRLEIPAPVSEFEAKIAAAEEAITKHAEEIPF